MRYLTRKAVATALAGTALSVAAMSTASASTTMYNMNNFGGLNTNTDGWVWSDPANTTAGGAYGTLGAAGPNVTTGTAPNVVQIGGNYLNYGSATRTANFVGTGSPSTTPFGFNATSSLNWAIQLTGHGDSGEISAQDSLTRYGVSAEVDTGAGAWQDASPVATNATTGVRTGPTGWKHQTDIGLIKVDQTTTVTLTPSVLPGGAVDFLGNFGITVFTGMDTSSASYSHHGRYNCPTCNAANFDFTNSNPFGTTGVTYLAHSGAVDSLNPFSFVAQAGQIYTIYIGGAGVGAWNANISNYKLDVAAVPIPAAVWLLGSALAGMGVVGRRGKKLTA